MADQAAPDGTAGTGTGAADAVPVLVPPAVSTAKLDTELGAWADQEQSYLRRGWRLRRVGDLEVEVVFLAAAALDPVTSLTVVAPCVRLRFDNYDLWPPSVEFVDALTGEPALPGLNVFLPNAAGEPRPVLVHPHPRTGRAFLCLPGVREYHDHPQHSGDDWLLHRDSDAGRLAVICDRIWRGMPKTIVGLEVQARWTPPVSELVVRLVQGDPDQLRAVAVQTAAAAAASAPAPGARPDGGPDGGQDGGPGGGPAGGAAGQGLMLAVPQPGDAP